MGHRGGQRALSIARSRERRWLLPARWGWSCSARPFNRLSREWLWQPRSSGRPSPTSSSAFNRLLARKAMARWSRSKASTATRSFNRLAARKFILTLWKAVPGQRANTAFNRHTANKRIVSYINWATSFIPMFFQSPARAKALSTVWKRSPEIVIDPFQSLDREKGQYNHSSCEAAFGRLSARKIVATLFRENFLVTVAYLANTDGCK